MILESFSLARERTYRLCPVPRAGSLVHRRYPTAPAFADPIHLCDVGHEIREELLSPLSQRFGTIDKGGKRESSAGQLFGRSATHLIRSRRHFQRYRSNEIKFAKSGRSFL